MTTGNDNRPKTVALHQWAGIGDFVFHIPYFKAIAAGSLGGKISIITSPSTFAGELLQAESWVDEIIYYDHRPRKKEKRKGRHVGLSGLFRFAGELRAKRFNRIILFSPKLNRAILARLAGIPQRLGFGFGFWQRLFLNAPPFIKPYAGEALRVYREATALSLAHGFCEKPLVPRLNVPPAATEKIKNLFAALPRPLYALGIGTSAPNKQWGSERFEQLAGELIARGAGIVLIGGSGETELAEKIIAGLLPEKRCAIAAFTHGSVIESAAFLRFADCCIGNDTGVVNMAAACERPSFVLIGNRPILDQDPLLVMLRSKNLRDITVDGVLLKLAENKAPGFSQ